MISNFTQIDKGCICPRCQQAIEPGDLGLDDTCADVADLDRQEKLIRRQGPEAYTWGLEQGGGL